MHCFFLSFQILHISNVFWFHFLTWGKFVIGWNFTTLIEALFLIPPSWEVLKVSQHDDLHSLGMGFACFYHVRMGLLWVSSHGLHTRSLTHSLMLPTSHSTLKITLTPAERAVHLDINTVIKVIQVIMQIMYVNHQFTYICVMYMLSWIISLSKSSIYIHQSIFFSLNIYLLRRNPICQDV